MAGTSVLPVLFVLLCLTIVLFYLFRLAYGRRWLRPYDAENDVGHATMAMGMTVMFAPAGSIPPDLLRWIPMVFAAASLWWLLRLLVHQPLLSLSRTYGRSVRATLQSAGMLAFMHGGMCYMFLLMSSMALGMTQPAIYANGLLAVSFACLTCFYGREIARDLQAVRRDWLRLGARLAHASLSSMMSWMFLNMLLMAARMRR